jgi:hypothetical protein
MSEERRRDTIFATSTGNLRTAEQVGRKAGWERVDTQQMGVIDVAQAPAFQG